MRKQYITILLTIIITSVVYYGAETAYFAISQNVEKSTNVQKSSDDNKTSLIEERHTLKEKLHDSPVLSNQSGVRIQSRASLRSRKNFKYATISDLDMGEGLGPYTDIDFSHCRIYNILLDSMGEVERCNFSNCSIYFGNIKYPSNTLDFSDAFFHSGVTLLHVDQNMLIQTQNFKEKDFLCCIEDVYCEKVDFSNFIFRNGLDGNFPFCDFSNARILGGIIGQGVLKGLSKQQFCSTWNYRNKIFLNLRIFGILEEHVTDPDMRYRNIDFKDFVFYNCFFGDILIAANLSNCRFIQCDLSHSTNLTVEQIKSTWNYKNNRMDLIILPPDLQKYFDEEKKEKE